MADETETAEAGVGDAPAPPRLERITSLLDLAGCASHARRLRWDPSWTPTDRFTRLAAHCGRGLLEGLDPSSGEYRELVGAACEEFVSPSNGRVEHGAAYRLDHARDGGAFAAGEPAYTARLRLHGRPEAVARMIDRTADDDEPGNARRLDVLLTPGLNERTLTAKRCTTTRPMFLGGRGMLMCSAYWRANERRATVVDADPAVLVGSEAVRRALMDRTGLDVFGGLSGDARERDRQWYSVVSDALDELAEGENAAWRQATRSGELRRGRIAGAFDDKLNPSARMAAAARQTSLRARFRHIEFDDDFDLKLLPQMEAEIAGAMDALPHALTDVSTLRVRKLGRYRGNTLGVYSPTRSAIVLDDGKATRAGYSGLSAFVHEYAHHLDHNTRPDGSSLSMDPEFLAMLRGYSRAVDHDDRLRGESDAFRDYLKTPTEVFARGFELWAHAKGCASSAMADPDTYASDPRYTTLDAIRGPLFALYDRLWPGFEPFDTLAAPARTAAETAGGGAAPPDAGRGAGDAAGEREAAAPDPDRVPWEEARFAVRLADGSYLASPSLATAPDMGPRVTALETADGVDGADAQPSLTDAARMIVAMERGSARVRRMLPAVVECVQTGRRVPANMLIPYLVDVQRERAHLTRQPIDRDRMRRMYETGMVGVALPGARGAAR